MAVCSTQANQFSPDHIGIISANIYFNDELNWFFNNELNGLDTKPDVFTFTDHTKVALNTVMTSDRILVTGLVAPAVVSILNGTYSLDGASFTSAAGPVTNGASIIVRHTSSASHYTTTNTTLVIGGTSDVFSSTTLDSISIKNSGGGGSFAILIILLSFLSFTKLKNYAIFVGRYY